jgi:hypothetical protein
LGPFLPLLIIQAKISPEKASIILILLEGILQTPNSRAATW